MLYEVITLYGLQWFTIIFFSTVCASRVRTSRMYIPFANSVNDSLMGWLMFAWEDITLCPIALNIITDSIPSPSTVTKSVAGEGYTFTLGNLANEKPLGWRFSLNQSQFHCHSVAPKDSILRITSYNVCYTKLLRSSWTVAWPWAVLGADPAARARIDWILGMRSGYFAAILIECTQASYNFV